MFKRNPQCIIHLSTETGTPPISIYEKKFIIGRKATHLVSIPDNSISRDHVEVIIKDDEVYIKDLGTANGTKIDGYLITPQIPVPCREGQILTLGLCSIGIVIEIFSKDKKKAKPNIAHSIQQQPDSQNNSYKPIFNSTAAPVFEYSNPDEVQDSHLDQPESPKYAEPAYQEPKPEQGIEPVYEEPKLEQSFVPAHPEAKLEQSYEPNHQESNIHISESRVPIYGNSEQEIMNNAKDEASRIIARAKVEIETNGREFLRSKELEAQNIINQAQQKSLDKIHEAEKHIEELLKKASNQAQELITSAQFKSQELLTQAQNETQILYKKNDEEVLKLKEVTLEEGRKEKQNIVAGAYLERESVLKETEQLKLNIPELNNRIDVIKAEIADFVTQKTTAEAEYTAQTKKVEAATAQVKIHDDQVAKLQDDFLEVQKKIELAEEKHKATLLSTQTLVQETHDTLARVTRRESELNGLLDGAKLQKEDAEKYSFAVKQDADKYSLNLKQDADKYANATKQDADKYSTTTKQDADKYANAAKQDADKYTINLKQDADKYSTATKQDADKYATTTKQAADKYATTTKQDADKYAQITKDETEAEIKRRLEFLQKETETIFANRDHELQELKATEEERTKSLFSIESQLASKQELMDQALSVKLAEQNATLNTQKELLEKEYATLKAQRETEFKNIRVQQDTFLNELRKSEEAKIRHMLEESQKMIHSQRNTKITHVQESLENFFNELQKSAVGELADQLPLLRDNLKRLMTDTLTNEYAGEESQLKKILDYNPEIANQHKKFWKKAAIASAFAVSALGASIYYHSLIQQIPQQMQTSMEETDRENKLATQQHLEAVRQAGIYRPAQDLNFKFNYTDNVIFTKNYMDFEYHEATHKEWTIKLNNFLLNTAGISDDQAIQFMASESSLVRNLESKKALIDGKNPESGIKNMRLLEDEYQIIIQSTLKDHKDEFWTLKKELYLKFIQENSQRIPAEEKN